MKAEEEQSGINMVAAERVAHEEKYGWTPEHDDKYDGQELRDAGIAYAIVVDDHADYPPSCWPFDPKKFKGDDGDVRNLVKAAALLVAEIDRYRRVFEAECNAFSQEALGFTVFDKEMDAYDLRDKPWVGLDPESFVREHFAEDFDMLVNEKEEYERSLEEEDAAEPV